MIYFWTLMSFLVLYLVRILKGPSIWDRLLAFGLISSKIVLLVVIYASVWDTAYFLDFAVIYALLGFICLTFTTIFLRDRLKEDR